MAEFTLYVRKDCVHCEQLQFALELLKQRISIDYSILDIDQDDTLIRDYGHRVPVLELGEQTVVDGVFDIETLEQDIVGSLARY